MVDGSFNRDVRPLTECSGRISLISTTLNSLGRFPLRNLRRSRNDGRCCCSICFHRHGIHSLFCYILFSMERIGSKDLR